MNLLKIDDWKHKNAALMALSQVGEYMTDKLEEIVPILDTIANHVGSDNPRIRYACLHCLGQLSDDMSPELEQHYHQKIIPMFMSRIDDPVPRVLSHAFAGLTNFLEHCPQVEVVKIMDTLYERLMYYLTNGSSFVKENALAALSALSEGAQTDFLKYYDNTMEVMIQFLREAKKKEYRQIRGQSIEAITIMSATVGKEAFAKFQNVIIEEMIKIQTHDIDQDGEDPQKNYLLSGWQRIMIILGDDFLPYVDSILPSLLQIVKKIVTNDDVDRKAAFKVDGTEEEIKNEGNTYEDDEAEISIEMLTVFLDNLGSKLCHWFQAIWEAIEPILKTWNTNVKIAAVKILPLLTKLLVASELNAQVPNFSRALIKRLWQGKPF